MNLMCAFIMSCISCVSNAMDMSENYLRGVDRAAALQGWQNEIRLPQIHVTPYQPSSFEAKFTKPLSPSKAPLYTMAAQYPIITEDVMHDSAHLPLNEISEFSSTQPKQKKVSYEGACQLLASQQALCLALSHEKLKIYDTCTNRYVKTITLPRVEGESVSNFKPLHRGFNNANPAPTALVSNTRGSALYAVKRYSRRVTLEMYPLTGSDAESVECKAIHSIKLDNSHPSSRIVQGEQIKYMNTFDLAYIPHTGVASLSSEAVTIWDEWTHKKLHTLLLGNPENPNTSSLHMVALDPNIIIFTSPHEKRVRLGGATGRKSFQYLEMCDLRDALHIQKIDCFDFKNRSIYALSKSSDSNYFLSASSTVHSAPVLEWDLRKNMPVREFGMGNNQLASINALAYSNDKLYATAIGGGTHIHIWDMHAPKQEEVVKACQSTPLSSLNRSHSSICISKADSCWIVDNDEVTCLDMVSAQESATKKDIA